MEEMPELNRSIITIVWDWDTGAVEVDSTGVNKMEAIGILDTALDKVRNDAFWESEHEEEDDDSGI